MNYDELSKKINNPQMEKDLEKKLFEIATPAIIFLVFLWFYMWIHDKYGFDRAIISLLIMILLTLQSISRNLNVRK